METKLILASSSPMRLALLKQMSITPDYIIAPNIDETPKSCETAQQLVKRLALAKSAQVVSMVDEDAIIIAADTVAAIGRRILNKAHTPDEVKNYLKLLSGRRHKVFTGLSIIKMQKGSLQGRFFRVVTSIVKFKTLTRQEIEFYANTNEGIGKAGGCNIHGFAQSYASFVSGSFSNIGGLPLHETYKAMTGFGYTFNANEINNRIIYGRTLQV